MPISPCRPSNCRNSGRRSAPARASSSTARASSIRWRTRRCGFLNLVANKMLFAAVHLAAVAALHRHAVRHQGAAAARLCAAQGRSQLFRRLRSVRRFRSDFRRLQARPQGRRNSDPLCQPHAMARPRSPASVTASCCCAWCYSHSCGSRRCDENAGVLPARVAACRIVIGVENAMESGS